MVEGVIFMKHKVTTILCSGVLATSLMTGCQSKTYSLAGQTITGEVETINDQQLVLELGSFDQNEWTSTDVSQAIALNSDVTYVQETQGQQGQMPPSMPSNQGQSSSEEGQQTPPEMTSENNSDASQEDQQIPPEQSQSSDQQTPPAMPSENSTDDSQGEQSMPPQMPGMNEPQTIEKDDIKEGDKVFVSFDKNEKVVKVTLMADNSQQETQTASYTAVKEISSDTTLTGETVESAKQDENAIWVSGQANVELSDMTLNRNSEAESSAENASFYGTSAALLSTEGNTYLKESTITTDAQGGAGAFAYGDGTLYVKDTTIRTSQGSSGGIHVAGGGTLYAWNLDVETQGQSSATIRSDRGGGTLVVEKGEYTSNGVGSPAVYSTADIAVKDATLTANGSEAICIEGMNSISLYDTDLTGNMSDDEQNDNTWNVILYQSMSGDSQEGNAQFSMDKGTLTAQNGGMFYTTNTESTFTLHDVEIQYAEENDFFLQCTGNTNQRGWGQAGQNGADCSFTAIEQEMEGNVIWDSISQLDFYMTEGSQLKGAFIQDNTYAQEGSGGYANVYVSKDSTWIVTGDSVVSQLQCAGTITDEQGKKVTIQTSQGEVLEQGDSEYTITVDTYSNEFDGSQATSIPSWKSFQQSVPQELK